MSSEGAQAGWLPRGRNPSNPAFGSRLQVQRCSLVYHVMPSQAAIKKPPCRESWTMWADSSFLCHHSSVNMEEVAWCQQLPVLREPPGRLSRNVLSSSYQGGDLCSIHWDTLWPVSLCWGPVLVPLGCDGNTPQTGQLNSGPAFLPTLETGCWWSKCRQIQRLVRTASSPSVPAWRKGQGALWICSIRMLIHLAGSTFMVLWPERLHSWHHPTVFRSLQRNCVGIQ